MVEGLYPLIDPLAPMLPRLAECFAVQLARIAAEDLAADPLDCLDLDPPGGAELAGRLDRPHVALERLGPGQRLQVLDALLFGAGLESRQQWAGDQLGTGVGAPQRRAALLAGGRVQALEHGPYLLS